MIPFLSLESLASNKECKSYEQFSQGFLIDCLKSNQTPDLSILSVDCLNSQDSVIKKRINIMYEDATKNIIDIFAKYQRTRYLLQWRNKAKPIQLDLKKLATGIVKLSYLINKKLRRIYLPTFINIQSLSQYKKSKLKPVAKLLQSVQLIFQKYYKQSLMIEAFSCLKNSKINEISNKNKLDKLVHIFNQNTKNSINYFFNILKANYSKIQKIFLFTQSLNYIMRECKQTLIKQVLLTIKQYSNNKTKQESAKSSTFNSSLKKTGSTELFFESKKSIDYITKSSQIIVSPQRISKKRYGKFQSQIKIADEIEQPQQDQKLTKNKLSKIPLRFSSPVRSRSKPHFKSTTLPTFSKPITINNSTHTQTCLYLKTTLQPLVNKFVNTNRNYPLYHLQPDINYTQVEDVIDNPQIFQLETIKPRGRNFSPRRSTNSHNAKKSLQFKSRVGSPVFFKQVMSPKLFKSRQNSQDKRKLSFNRPNTSKKSPKKYVQFKLSSPQYIKQSYNEIPAFKQISKARVQNPFIQQKSKIIFDTKAYFNQ